MSLTTEGYLSEWSSVNPGTSEVLLVTKGQGPEQPPPKFGWEASNILKVLLMAYGLRFSRESRQFNHNSGTRPLGKGPTLVVNTSSQVRREQNTRVLRTCAGPFAGVFQHFFNLSLRLKKDLWKTWICRSKNKGCPTPNSNLEVPRRTVRFCQQTNDVQPTDVSSTINRFSSENLRKKCLYFIPMHNTWLTYLNPASLDKVGSLLMRYQALWARQCFTFYNDSNWIKIG